MAVDHHKTRYKLACSLNVLAIFSSMLDFAVYVSTMRITCPLAAYGDLIGP